MTLPACVTSGLPAYTWDDHIHGETDRAGRARIAAAKAVCADCPLRQSCAVKGKKGREPGVWGGVYRNYRGHIRQAQTVTPDVPPEPRLAPSPHGTARRYKQERRQGLPTCGPCREANNAYNRAWRRRTAAA